MLIRSPSLFSSYVNVISSLIYFLFVTTVKRTALISFLIVDGDNCHIRQEFVNFGSGGGQINQILGTVVQCYNQGSRWETLSTMSFKETYWTDFSR